MFTCIFNFGNSVCMIIVAPERCVPKLSRLNIGAWYIDSRASSSRSWAAAHLAFCSLVNDVLFITPVQDSTMRSYVNIQCGPLTFCTTSGNQIKQHRYRRKKNAEKTYVSMDITYTCSQYMYVIRNVLEVPLLHLSLIA